MQKHGEADLGSGSEMGEERVHLTPRHIYRAETSGPRDRERQAKLPRCLPFEGESWHIHLTRRQGKKAVRKKCAEDNLLAL